METHPPTKSEGNGRFDSPDIHGKRDVGRDSVIPPPVIAPDSAQNELPMDFARTSAAPRIPTQVTFVVSAEISRGLRNWTAPSAGCVPLALATLYGLVLYKLSGGSSVAFAVAGALAPAEGVVGAVLGFDLGKTLRSHAIELGDILTSGRGSSAYPPSRCRAAFEAGRKISASESLNGLAAGRSHDLVMQAEVGEGAITLIWTAPNGLLRASTLKALGETFLRLTEAAAIDPDLCVRDLPFMSESDRETVLLGWNATRRNIPEKGIARIFREQAVQRPDAIALSLGDRHLSYAELDAQSNGIARVLLRHGVGPGTACSVCLERSFELVATLIGILKTGAAYVALDPAHPRECVTHMHTRAGSRAVVSRAAHGHKLEQCPGAILFWEALGPEAAREPSVDPAIDAGPGDLAYVCFTSGSTGEPKGVAVTQRGCVRLVVNADYARLTHEETFLLHSPLSFDASTFELWAPLLNGGRLEILPAGQLDIRFLGKTIAERRISTLWLTAALFAALVDERLNYLRGVRQLITGGDVVSIEHARRYRAAFPQSRLINGYGPTENTTFSTCHTVEGDDLSRVSVPIGKPIANSTAYILDPEGQPVPPLFQGELFVGGDGIALGYVGDPVLTAERFETRNICGQSVRVYRTGDRARWLLNGSIEFLGRLDHQVKIDGYRVELGAVEAALLGIPGIQSAAAVAFGGRARKQLAAFVVGSLDGKSVQQALRGSVPDYLVPSIVRRLTSLPLNRHGKVDRPGLLAILQEERESKLDPPQTIAEQRLHLIWQECLNLTEIGIHDDFFDLGGKSLDAAKLFAMISREFGLDLPLAKLVEAPTIAQLGELLTRAHSSSDVLVTPFGPAPSGGSGTWFLIPGAGSGPIVFVDLAKSLKTTHAVVGLQAAGLDGTRHNGTWPSIPSVAQEMITEIVARQDSGPYLIGGHCFGAVLAREIAFQLEALGHTVGALALLDPIVSDVFYDDVFGGPRWPYHWRRLLAAPWRRKAAYVSQRCSNFFRTILARSSIRPAQKLARHIHATYAFPPYGGRVCVVLAGDSFYGLAQQRDPRRFFEQCSNGGEISYHTVAGDHHTILHEDGAESLAAILRGLSIPASTSHPILNGA